MPYPQPSELVESLRAAWNAKYPDDEWSDCRTPELTTIVGFIRQVTLDGVNSYRIYLNHSLTAYYDIAIDDVVFWLDLEPGPDSGARVWVRQGARTRLVRVRSGRAEVAPRLLSGPVVQNYLAGTPAPPAGQPAYQPIYGQAPGVVWPEDDDDGGGWQGSGCSRSCFSHSP